jgi:hypothetical protein
LFQNHPSPKREIERQRYSIENKILQNNQTALRNMKAIFWQPATDLMRQCTEFSNSENNQEIEVIHDIVYYPAISLQALLSK